MFQVHLIVSGKVQGVFYRASCQEVAQELGLTGWVKNLPDGSVKVLVQGEKETIEKLIKWCKCGPPNSKVSDIRLEWESMSEKFRDFSIR